eukprot:98392_1
MPCKLKNMDVAFNWFCKHQLSFCFSSSKLMSEQQPCPIWICGPKRNKTIWISGPTRRFVEDFQIIQQALSVDEDYLLIYGYIRVFEANALIISIPEEIKRLLLLFYHSRYPMDIFDIYGTTRPCIERKTQRRYCVRQINKHMFYRIPCKYRSRYLRAMHDELDILHALCHPNIAKLQSLFEDKNTMYIIKPECNGGTLFDNIAQRKRFTEHDASKIIKQILSALRYMHEENDIVHCSLNPQNIFFVNNSDDLSIKIHGFGMSKLLPRLHYLTHLRPTSYYSSPEKIKDKKYNASCDMWAVGIILYIMMFGYPPFHVDSEQYGQREANALYEKIRRGFVARVRRTERRGFGPWFPDHLPRSGDVKQLISKLLEHRARNRYTAREALQHPWIANTTQLQETEPLNMDSLRKFNNVCEFKRHVIERFRERFERMEPKHFKELETKFIKMDKDCVVSYKQLKDVLSTVKELKMTKQYMHFGGETCDIEYKSLLNGLVHDYLVSHDLMLYGKLRTLDEDDDGNITTKQLRETFKAYDRLSEWDRAIGIINQLDRNGVIEYEDFLLNLHPTFEDGADWMPNTFKKMKSCAV